MIEYPRHPLLDHLVTVPKTEDWRSVPVSKGLTVLDEVVHVPTNVSVCLDFRIGYWNLLFKLVHKDIMKIITAQSC